ncbi:HET-domain-containing protein [Daldinia caldariorum]|uniref:HET-domain-containing protein n=1 Tax=Daldinia caldariorum TaxID=326644 RepID=UPI00200850E3|nr:HET-domain-containing protein [Daldinia caldariorum]KAI1466140.1 HET-domain-containing protein [Daldinia caldariorum]
MSKNHDVITALAPSSTERDFICDECKAIDFNKALAVPAAQLRDGNDSECGILLDTNASRYASSPNPACKLCRILRSTICWYHEEWWSDPDEQADHDAIEDFELYAFASSRNVPWGFRKPGPDQDYHILITLPAGFFASFGDHSRQCGRGEAGYVFCFDKIPSPGLFRPLVIPKQFDYQRARVWLEFCREHHGQQCWIAEEIVPGMELIDCETWTVVEAKPGMRWVALSYIWKARGDATDADSKVGRESSSPRLPSSVPTSIKDAATVVRQLGLRYLWVDRYCIDQSKEEEKDFHISRMDAIYRGAELVIITAAGTDEDYGLPGVGSTPRLQQDIVPLESSTIFTTGPDPRWHVQEHSRWWTRGWTYQEGLLASRRLVFTDHQAYFECHGATWMESVGGVEFAPNQKIPVNLASMKAARKRLFKPLGSTISTDLNIPPRVSDDGSTSRNDYLVAIQIREWCQLVGQYTSRTLSHDVDSLNAFAGIARLLSKLERPTLHLVGLPYVLTTDDTELTDRYFFASFCWHHSKDCAPRRRPDFPSWSWSGWAGPVTWMGVWVLERRAECDPKWRNVRIQDSTEQSRPVSEYLAQHTPIDNGIPPPLAICFEARVVPLSLFQFNIRTPDDGRVNTFVRDEDEDEDEESRDNTEDDDNENDDEFQSNNEDGNEVGNENDSHGENEDDSDDEEGEDEASPEDEPAVPDPDNWGLWTIGIHRVHSDATKPTKTPNELLDHLKDGTWSCLLIGDYSGNGGYTHERFLLVVKWLDEKTATRVGALVLQQHYYLDQAFPDFFDESGLDWRSVRLV